MGFLMLLLLPWWPCSTYPWSWVSSPSTLLLGHRDTALTRVFRGNCGKICLGTHTGGGSEPGQWGYSAMLDYAVAENRPSLVQSVMLNHEEKQTVLHLRGLHSYWCARLGGHDNKQSNEQIVSNCKVVLHGGNHLAYHHAANLQF